jgi:diguanylate cyclase (GGDEF)-like protein
MPRLSLALNADLHAGNDFLDLSKHTYLLIAMMVAVIFAVYMGMLLTYERTEQELVESQRQLRAMVDVDMLTQLPNRRHFMDLAQQTVRISPPNSCTLMMVDIAGFKHINEVYGHAAGESALRLVSSAARQLLRGRDLVGRLGGDQFVALLPDTSSQDSLRVVERLRKQVEHMQKRSEREHVQVNIAILPLLEHATMDQALHRLTEALTESEHYGKGRVIQVNAHDGSMAPIQSVNAMGPSAG